MELCRIAPCVLSSSRTVVRNLKPGQWRTPVPIEGLLGKKKRQGKPVRGDGLRIYGPHKSDMDDWTRNEPYIPPFLKRRFAVRHKWDSTDEHLYSKEAAEYLGDQFHEHVVDEYGTLSPYLPKEMLPELVAPDLTDFELKPYVSYQVDDPAKSPVDYPKVTEEDYFYHFYGDAVEKAFKDQVYDEKTTNLAEGSELDKERRTRARYSLPNVYLAPRIK